MWASVAPAWGEHAGYVDARAAQVTEKMLDLADVRPGEDVLELACGAGGAGLAAADRIGPDGRLVLSDVVAQMTAIAQARADALGLDNVTSRVLDLEQIDQPDASYDAVLCREGLMFAVDPARAAREITRVLRPGGRVSLAVWGPRAQNPWLGLVLDAVSAQLGHPVPPPGVPGPFSLEDARELHALLTDAGLADVTVTAQPVGLHTASLEEWWTRTSALAGPLARILAGLAPDVTEQLRARVRDAARPYTTAGGLDFPGVSLLAVGRRPA